MEMPGLSYIVAPRHHVRRPEEAGVDAARRPGGVRTFRRRFPTPSGKLEFYTARMTEAGLRPARGLSFFDDRICVEELQYRLLVGAI
jgi:hypothetical protein